MKILRFQICFPHWFVVRGYFGDSSFPPLLFKWRKRFNISKIFRNWESHIFFCTYFPQMSNIRRHGEKNWVTQRLMTRNIGYVPTVPCSSIPICWIPLTHRAVKALVVIWVISCRLWQLAVTVECYVNLTGKGSQFRGQMFVICMYWLQRTLGPHPIASCISLSGKSFFLFFPQIHPVDYYWRKGVRVGQLCEETIA